ncbi:MAG: hypothetical protein ABWZ98_01740 [Nakamurella sp.]
MSRAPSLSRSVGVLLALFVALGVLCPMASFAVTADPTTEAGSAPPGWTAEQAIAALTAGPVAQLMGSPAVFDAAALTTAIGSSNVKILAVPFARPVKLTDSDMDDATSDELDKVRSWSYEQDADLITVVGLKINLSGLYEQWPDSVPDLQRVMVRSDLTQSLLFSIAFEQSGRDAADAAEQEGVLETEQPADPADTETIATELAADNYYAAPGVDAPATAFPGWQEVGPDRLVRVALLPGPAAGQPLVDELTPLAARFPDDIVVVASGRWVQMAGPDQQLLDSAVLYGYGAFYNRVVQNDLPAANLSLGMLRRVGALRTGAVTDQQGPATTDPVSGVSRALPWLFLGTAVIVVAGLLLIRRRRVTRTADVAREDRRARSRTTAQLAMVSGQILDLDGLAGQGEARELLTRATERYGTARDLLRSGGDRLVAQSAIDAASDLLARAAAVVGVPLAGAWDETTDSLAPHGDRR